MLLGFRVPYPTDDQRDPISKGPLFVFSSVIVSHELYFIMIF